MPRYFIHVRNGSGYAPDEEGRDFPDLEAARQIAIDSGVAMLAEELKGGHAFVNVTLFIEDEQGEELLRIPVSGVIEQ